MRKALMVACFLPSLAWADTLPNSVIQARERMEQDPGHYDRADQFCAEKKVGSSCVIPGNPFEGGGNGTCRTSPNRDSGAIESRCALNYRPEVLGSLPDGGYRAPETICENGEIKEPFARAFSSENLSCLATPVVSDKYCSGKAVGSPCSVDVRSESAESKYPGLCAESEDSRRLYYHGYMRVTRTVLTCRPEKPVIINIRESSPPGWLRRLLD